MNIWVEYWKHIDKRNNTHAQMKEQAKWEPPDPSSITKRFCQTREEASRLAKSLGDQCYHVQIKTDGLGT